MRETNGNILNIFIVGLFTKLRKKGINGMNNTNNNGNEARRERGSVWLQSSFIGPRAHQVRLVGLDGSGEDKKGEYGLGGGNSAPPSLLGERWYKHIHNTPLLKTEARLTRPLSTHYCFCPGYPKKS